MKILVTGAYGFLGKNLVCELRNRGYTDIFLCGRQTTQQELMEYTAECAFVFHLAGVNRAENDREFYDGNTGFTQKLVDCLEKQNNHAPILMSSSIKAEESTPYGISKKMAETCLYRHMESVNAPVYIYRLPNVFGKWAKPEYNSAAATFCYRIARGLPVQIHYPCAQITLCYIDDVIHEWINQMETQGKGGQHQVSCTYPITVEQLAQKITAFRENRNTLRLPNVSDPLTKKLYSTYLSYLPENAFSYPLCAHTDSRGSFTEFLKTDGYGQISVNVIKPGITKGNHWHHTKNEKFFVVSGSGVIRFRNVLGTDVVEYFVSAQKPEVVDIPCGYTHSITNTGSTDMTAVIWGNELFDPENTDTYFMEV